MQQDCKSMPDAHHTHTHPHTTLHTPHTHSVQYFESILYICVCVCVCACRCPKQAQRYQKIHSMITEHDTFDTIHSTTTENPSHLFEVQFFDKQCHRTPWCEFLNVRTEAFYILNVIYSFLDSITDIYGGALLGQVG